MEKTHNEIPGHIDSKKRARDDPSSDSPESKIPRVELCYSEANSSCPILNRVESDDSCSNADSSSENSVDSSDVRWIQDDLLNLIDESDESAIQGLDSVIKSFEEEILIPTPAPETVSGVEVNFPGRSQPELGYLLEASDDELGLPPAFSSDEEGKIGVDDLIVASGLDEAFIGETLGFEGALPNYDSFEFEKGRDSDSNSYHGPYDDSCDFVALFGLFDHSDGRYVPAKMADGVTVGVVSGGRKREWQQ